MLKSELIEQLATEYPHLTHRDVERAVNLIFESMIATLEMGGRVELRGFGAFTVRSRRAGKARNPRTGELVDVGDRKMPHFKVGRSLHNRLNGTAFENKDIRSPPNNHCGSLLARTNE